MAFIVPEDIDRYAEEHTTPPDERMARLAAETRAELDLPQMLTGAVEGRFLEMLAFATGARLALDIGTFSGYSALSLAAGMGPEGRVVTCEANPENAAFARRHIEASPYADRIELREGPALASIASLDGPLDLVFVDADKPSYAAYVEAVLPKLSERGLIAIDNTLWSGRVLETGEEDESTVALRRLNDFLAADERLVCVMLTVRDGITLVRRAQAGPR